MGDLDSVTRYLGSLAAEREEGAREPAPPFLTISREPGAGGRRLADAFLAELERRRGDPVFEGWHLFDKALCEKVASDPRLKVSIGALLDEKFRGQLEDFFIQYVAGESPQRLVMRRVYETVRALAGAGKAVILGRAAACYLRDLPAGLHVRVVAPLEWRLESLVLERGWTHAEAVAYVKRTAEDRAALAREYFRRDIEDPGLYDAVYNTAYLTPQEIAAELVSLIGRRAAGAGRLGVRR